MAGAAVMGTVVAAATGTAVVADTLRRSRWLRIRRARSLCGRRRRVGGAYAAEFARVDYAAAAMQVDAQVAATAAAVV